MLDNSHSINDLRSPPVNRLEKLSADRSGQYRIRINDTWRVCFIWRDGDAFQVEIVDYNWDEVDHDNPQACTRAPRRGSL